MTRTMLLVTTLLVGCATGAVVREVVAPARAQGQAALSYEYDAVMVANGVENAKPILAQFCKQGWRLVTATQEGPFRTMFFERQLPAQ
jgi:hypothetical protein